MTKTGKNMYRFLIIIALIALSGCQSVNSRGTFIDDNMLDQVRGQKLTKDQLLYTLGTPTLKPTYSPNKWYYVSRNVRNKSWNKPKLMKQRIVEVIFKDDLVEDIIVHDSKYQPDIKISKDATISKGTEENPIQTFVKNFGRFNKTKKPKRR